MTYSVRPSIAAIGLVLLALASGTSAALADRRVALVIGNSAYQNTVQLANPRNDAADVAKALKGVGFEVIEGYDLDKRDMDDAFRRFAHQAAGADAALFYYGGHGMQYQGENYLMPVDAKLTGVEDIAYEMSRVDDILSDLQRASGVRIVMLDACRDNPLTQQVLAKAAPSRSLGISRGLARIQQTAGSIIAYSTQPGAVAADGNGRNSPFAAAFLGEVGKPNVEIGSMFRRVAADVYKSTDERQLPEVTISLLGDFYFVGNAPPAAAIPQLPVPNPIAPGPAPAALDPQAQVAVDGCDRLAASPLDMDRPSGVPGVERDQIQPKLAVDACRAALTAAPNDRRVQFQLARALDVAGQEQEVRELLTRSGAAGSVSAMSDLAYMLETGEGGPRDLPQAVALFDKAAAAGNVAAMRNVAIEFENGTGRPRNAAQAAEWYQKAADTGDPQAMGFLAVLYLQGTGVPKNAGLARQWIDKLLATEHTQTILRVGYVLLGQTGAVKDFATARSLFRRAAELGNSDGNVMLANMAANGLGSPRDFKGAVGLFERAAAIGNVNAKASLMPFLMYGMGGARLDPGLAADYGLEALHGGSPVARTFLIDKWQANLTPATREAVERRLAEAGLLSRKPDGRYGPDTLAALQTYILAK